MTTDLRLQRIARYFETLSPATLAGLGEVYTPQATFKDPFQTVQGTERTRRVWDLVFDSPRMPDGRWRIHGASHLELAGDGRIATHRDYWDPAEELYEKTPLLGGLMRLIKRRLRTPGL